MQLQKKKKTVAAVKSLWFSILHFKFSISVCFELFSFALHVEPFSIGKLPFRAPTCESWITGLDLFGNRTLNNFTILSIAFSITWHYLLHLW